MAKIFFSYSHKDEELRNQLETHLVPLKRQGLIETWHDRRIGAGEDFEHEIDIHLEEADVILFLISADFLASDYCYDKEVNRALERHEVKEAKVIPIILRPCDWKDLPFGKLQACPKDGKAVTKHPNADEAFLDIAESIKRVIKNQSVPKPIAKNADIHTSELPRVEIQNNTLPRSSNLRVKKVFTQKEKDKYFDNAFEYLSNFFEGSLKELEKRNREIDTAFRRISANKFSSVVYLNGEEASRCSIWFTDISSASPNGIKYTYGGLNENSYNELLTVEDDGYHLYLRPMGMSMHRIGEDDKLSFEGAAEFFWALFLENLQN